MSGLINFIKAYYRINLKNIFIIKGVTKWQLK